MNLEKSLFEQGINAGSVIHLRGRKKDVKEVVKNASSFISKSVHHGFVQGTEKLRKMKEDYDSARESVARKPGSPPSS